MGMATARVVQRYSYLPIADVSVLTTYGDQILSSGNTDANGETTVLVAEGGEITMIDPMNLDITFFETTIGADYLFPILRYGLPPAPTLSLAVSGPPTATVYLAGSISCLRGSETSPMDVPKNPRCLTAQNTMNVFAQTTLNDGSFYGAAAFDVPVATTSLSISLAPISDEMELVGTFPASWPAVTNHLLQATPTFGDLCGLPNYRWSNVQSSGFSESFPVVATSASGIMVAVIHESPNQNRGLQLETDARTLDLTTAMMEIPAVPGPVTLDTSAGVRFTFAATEADAATILLAHGNGLRWLGVLPPDATEAHVPPRTTPPPIPTTYTLGAQSRPDTSSHTEWWRTFDCSAPHSWAYDRIGLASF